MLAGGADPGGVDPGGGGAQKLHKEGKNVVTVTQTPPFRNPVSAPGACVCMRAGMYNVHLYNMT